MPITSIAYATTAADNGGTDPWTTPTAVTGAPNGTGAQCDLRVGASTNELRCTGFGLSIPTDATIQGVECTVTWARAGEISEPGTLRLLSAGALIGTARTGTAGPTLAAQTVGGTADLWGAALTPTILNAAGFGVSIRGDAQQSDNLWTVDAVGIRVAFVQPGSGRTPRTISASVSIGVA